jgi:hypothetical protein
MPAGDVISGENMTVQYGSTPAAALHVGMWTIAKKREVGKYASNSTSGWRKTTAGVKDWSGTMNVFIHDGAVLEWSIEGAVVDMQFHPTFTASTDESTYYSGQIRITEVTEEYDSDSGDPVAANITFEGHGALTSSGTVVDV